MKKRLRALHKIFSVISGLSLVFNSILPASLLSIIVAPPAYAQEATQSATDQPTPTITEAPTPTDTVTPTPDATPTIIETPTETPTPTDTPVETITPTQTDTPTPTEVAQPTETGPPATPTQEQGQILDGATTVAPTPTETVTPAPVPEPTGHIEAAILKNASALSLNLSSTDISGSAVLTTNKPDYAPTDTVVISGTGFIPDHPYKLFISSTDPPPVNFSTEIKTNSTGDFIYSYQLDGNYRPNYSVAVKKGDTTVATTTFTDSSAANLDQCTNGGVGKTPERCANSVSNWVNGNANKEKAHWSEGDFISYRTTVTDVTSGIHTLDISYHVVNSSKHAIDYLGSFDVSETTDTATSLHANQNDPCSDKIPGCVPSAPTASLSVPAATLANCGGSSGTIPSVQIPGSIKVWGPSGTTITGITYNSENVLQGSNNCSTSARISFNVGGSASSNILVFAWGGHIAKGPGGIDAWGVGNSATAINGSPYHMSLDALDGSSTGSQDRALSAGAIIPPSTITIHKVTDPSGGTGFTFATTGGLSPSTFSLNGGENTSYITVIPGSYSVTENDPTPYNLTNLVCTASGTGTSATPNLGTRSVSITIGSSGGGNVDCTYTNTFNKVSPTISTTLSSSNVDVGSTVHDSSTLSGATSDASGTVTYTVYTDNSCTQNAQAAGTKTVTNGVIPDSNSITFTSAGDYYWQAVYSGDAKNNGATSTCTSEHLVVNKVTPSISTIPSAGGTVGITVHDSATVTGGDSPTGTVTFKLYGATDGTCSNGAIFTDTQTLSGGSAVSGDYTTASAGTYHWTATYNGNANNTSVTSACSDETVTINMATPTLTTNASGPVTVGSTIHDVAHLSGGYGTLTGNITFDVFASGDTTCSTPIAVSPTKTVSGTGDYTSGDYTTSAVGDYRWIAHYSGDGNNNPVDTACNDTNESSATQKATPTLTTTATAGPVTVGGTINDTAHLSGGYGTLGGSVTFDVFAPDDTTCATPINVPPSKTVSGGGDYTSGSYTTAAVGTYRWIAHYSGDTNNNAVNTSCNDTNESSTTRKAAPSIQTTPSTGGTVGTQIHDTATVTGGYNPTGNVTFSLYDVTDTSCANSSVFTDTQPLTSGSSTSGDFTTVKTGTYHWKATYNGDANNIAVTSACADEPVTITKLSPTIATTLSATSVDVGSAVHDSSTLTGATSNAGGTVTYTVYTDNACTQGAQSAGTKTVTNGSVPDSNDISFTGAGDYYWQAAYTGDGNNNSATSTCTSEHLVVNKVAPTLTTTASGPVTIGTTIHDTAHLSGGYGTLGGSITFDVFAPGDTACSNSTPVSPTKTVSGTEDYVSGDFTTTAVGDYRWIAHYSGDGNNNAVDTACNDANETSTVNKADTRLSTQVHDASNTDITNTSVALGTSVHDSAIVSGQVGQIVPTGTLTYKFYDNGTCNGNLLSTEVLSVGTESATKSALGAGTYSYLVSYGGDDNYNGSTATCEPVTINKAQLSVETTVHDSNHTDQTDENVPLGSVMHDTAVISGEVQGFTLPDVSFSLTSNYTESCSDGTAVGNDGTEEGAVKSADSAALGAGNYAYHAVVGDNDNYIGSDSQCEPFTVEQGTPRVTTTIHDADHNAVGPELLVNTVHDSATISGIQGFDPTGTVDFRFYEDNACEGEYSDAGTVDLDSNGVAHPSDSQGPLDAGFYAFQAHYNGDGNYSATDSACEPFTLTTLQISKRTLEGDGSFSYAVGGPTNVSPSITTSGGSGQTALIPILAGKYSIAENPITGWRLRDSVCGYETSPTSYVISAGTTGTCSFTNEPLNPILTITKENNTGGADLSPGASVLYTLTVTATQSAAFHVTVTDLLPAGFTYRPGSWTANSNKRGDIKSPLGPTTEPTYASPGKWQLGDMIKDETVTLTYIADISSSQQAGLYHDLAWAAGCKTNATCGDVLSNATDPGFVDNHYVGTQVSIVTNTQSGVSHNVINTVESQVLGASTELPATGANTFWLFVAFALITGGISIGALGWFLRRKYA